MSHGEKFGQIGLFLDVVEVSGFGLVLHVVEGCIVAVMGLGKLVVLLEVVAVGEGGLYDSFFRIGKNFHLDSSSSVFLPNAIQIKPWRDMHNSFQGTDILKTRQSPDKVTLAYNIDLLRFSNGSFGYEGVDSLGQD